MAESTTGEMKRSLTLTGITVNAMALIAPGAFLWTTFQLQAVQTVSGKSTAPDMWTGLFFALILALLTAYSYSELARIYPDAGTGSSYYFAEAALLEKEKPEPPALGPGGQADASAGSATSTTGCTRRSWSASWGSCSATSTATVFHHTLTYIPQAAAAVVLACICGYIAYRGVSGSTMTSIVINVIQITCLVAGQHPLHRLPARSRAARSGPSPTPAKVIIPHSFIDVIYQSTIAILLLVGFESVTALGAEAINPDKDIKRGVLLSLIIQGGICYLFEYFAANFAVGTTTATFTNAAGQKLTGLSASAADPAPIGTMIHNIAEIARPHRDDGVADRRRHRAHRPARHDAGLPQHRRPGDLRHGQGQGDAGHPGAAARQVRHAPRRHPRPDGPLGGHRRVLRHALQRRQHHPDHGGVQHGTFLVYGMSCMIAIVAFAHRHDKHLLKHYVVPGLGALMNLAELFGVVYLAVKAGGNTSKDAYKSHGHRRGLDRARGRLGRGQPGHAGQEGPPRPG